MESTTFNRDPVPVNQAARALRVPVRWLRGEVEGGRLPGLRAGNVILVDLPTVKAMLAERARNEVARD